MKWQDKLSNLVAYYQENPDPPDPCFLYTPHPPVDHQWPPGLPGCDDIREFYKISGGGEFGPGLRFIPILDLLEQANHWIKTLSNYDERGD